MIRYLSEGNPPPPLEGIKYGGGVQVYRCGGGVGDWVSISGKPNHLLLKGIT